MSTSQIAKPPVAAESVDEREQIELDVTGMSCGSCAARVQSALAAAPGVAEIEAAEATDRAGWLRRVLLAVPLAAVVVALTYSEPHDLTARWIVAGLTAPIQFWCGMPFLRGAWERARARTTNMDTLVALATLTAFVYATVELLVGPSVHMHGGPGGELNAHLHYDIPAVIIAFLCVGRWCEATARNRADRAVRELTMLGAQGEGATLTGATVNFDGLLRPGHSGRRRYCACQARRAGRTGAGLTAADSTPRRSDREGVRAGGARARVGNGARMGARRPVRARAVRGRGRARRRLPLRSRPGHARRAGGRFRAGRRPRDLRQGVPGAGVVPLD
jgi:copper chaperone CopZ